MLFPEIKQERVLRKQNLPCFCENVDNKENMQLFAVAWQYRFPAIEVTCPF